MRRRVVAVVFVVTALAMSVALATAGSERDLPRGTVTYIRVTD